MTGSNASLLVPLTIGQSDSGDFSSWLGRPVQKDEETYVMVQASVAIASGSQGKQLQTALSSGVASWVVTLSTGDGHLNCGAIPSSLTTAIASGAYFLALRDSSQHTMLVRGTVSGSVAVGAPCVVGTGSDLIPIFTGSMTSALTGVASTSSGLGVIFSQFTNRAGVFLTADTGVAAVTGSVRYAAPFRE